GGLPDLFLWHASLFALVITVLVLCRKTKTAVFRPPRTRTCQPPRRGKAVWEGKRVVDVTTNVPTKKKDETAKAITTFLNTNGQEMRPRADNETILEITDNFGTTQEIRKNSDCITTTTTTNDRGCNDATVDEIKTSFGKTQ
ncbi:hypothetical protein PRIPAC_73265, partial [Pristionchus pacificus]|uniref:Uncharacterized protein n=1 Tax=Pristionchus pacificus TaxID=54126 RepID=A0A2A6C7D0_PRIPA